MKANKNQMEAGQLFADGRAIFTDGPE